MIDLPRDKTPDMPNMSNNHHEKQTSGAFKYISLSKCDDAHDSSTSVINEGFGMPSKLSMKQMMEILDSTVEEESKAKALFRSDAGDESWSNTTLQILHSSQRCSQNLT